MGHARVTYAQLLLEPALKDSLGVMVFQEQVIKVAQVIAGFTSGEGELLCRALGSKHAPMLLDGLQLRFVEGAVRTGVPEVAARKVFEQLRAFGSFSFAKSHAASFALITYWHAWLRRYYPSAFFCGILRNMPMGFYPLASVMSDAQRTGVTLLHPDINQSQVLPMLEARPNQKAGIRLGLVSIDGIGETAAQAILTARGENRFASLNDAIARTTMDGKTAEDLILAGTFDTFGERRQLLWDLVAAFERRGASDSCW